jgi:mono/diheme cytochrome c family protein
MTDQGHDFEPPSVWKQLKIRAIVTKIRAKWPTENHSMRPKSGRLFAILITLACVPNYGIADDRSAAVDFNREIRPILSDACYQCHGPDANKRKADLRLDLREGLFRVSDGTAIVDPGKPDESKLLARVTADDPSERMPPPGHGSPLSKAQIEVIRQWITSGAPWKGHWAYIPLARPEVPLAPGSPTATNAIDRFIDARISTETLIPSPPADRRTLVRRLSFDLLGMPPSPEDVQSFECDDSPTAYIALVDRLLASPHFGERMATFWLDLVRYADTTGYHGDNHVDLYLFRDYVIRAFNGNKHFDTMTIEQLAGDLLPGKNEETLIASGYNRLLQTTQEGGAQAKEYMAKYSADRVRNVSTVWLGATMRCSECHDHKFDPYKTREFYALAAFFADVKETAVGVQEPTRFPSPEQTALLGGINQSLAADRSIKTPDAAVRKRIADLEARKNALLDRIPNSLVTTSVEPRMIRVLPRGNWLDDSGLVVAPGIPEFLPPLTKSHDRATRLDLARWLTSKENPLVARVIVNRLWKLMFGEGLVTTPDDFGSQGAWPSHPELLDWLASEFIDRGWDVKLTLRQIVATQAYRRSSVTSELNRKRDPSNRWLARQNRYRLDAEFIRDTALATSGLLARAIGGPSVKPYQPAGYWVFLNFPRRDYQADNGASQFRRGLYTYWQRTFLHPSLLAFDASTREECVVQRPRSNTPLQALVLLNDPSYVEAARALAARAIREGGSDRRTRLDRAFQLTLSRSPDEAEAKLLLNLFAKHYDQFTTVPADGRALIETGYSKPETSVSDAELAAWTSVARVLLNIQEAITRS